MKNSAMYRPLYEADPQIAAAIDNEARRQHEGLELIASENFVSEAVLEAAGSCSPTSTPRAIPASATTAAASSPTWSRTWRAIAPSNCSARSTPTCSRTPDRRPTWPRMPRCLQPGDTILGLNLAHGGHLTHGHQLNFSGKTYKIVPYGVTKETETHRLRRVGEAGRERTAEADHRRAAAPIRASLILRACGRLPTRLARSSWWTWRTSPGWLLAARIPRRCRTRTSSPRLRTRLCAAPRRNDPGQGRIRRRRSTKWFFPERKAGRWCTSSPPRRFVSWRRCSRNSASMLGRSSRTRKCWRQTLADEGFRIVSGGTDTHLMLVDVFSKGMLGSEAEKALGDAGITVNKNAIPFDTNPPMKPSGIRVGTPALTTRGMKEDEMRQIGTLDRRVAAQSHRCGGFGQGAQAGARTCARRFRCMQSGAQRRRRKYGPNSPVFSAVSMVKLAR